MVNQPKNEEAIFIAAIQIESREERDTYLTAACGEDKKLRADVEALLKAHDAAGSFLESPPAGMNGTLDAGPLTEGPGMSIGRYKLLQLIGEGGFGVVYMAEQEEPIRRKVALKIIKLGMDTKQVIARFEAERQALAMMDHPNIARVFDAGATDTGRPYFVMELVKGIPITEYCDENNLDTHQRLELFIDVCKAVQHAHQKGIIHRDIKPSNVMITLHDGKPVPKIIDFGIAKATQQRLTEKTLFTEYRQFIGTPEYMSPEQAQMSGLDIDTRSDIYSLGVLLYELLTGTTPFEADKLRSAAYDEIRRIIREDEPPKPSTRLSTLGDALTDIAKRRDAQPGELCKIVRGDLDWVVMKSLEKDRTRRYETANELAMDIERHLGDEPVSAGPPSVRYRLTKFIRRHRTGVAAGLLVAAAIVVGLIVSTTMYLRAEQARKKENAARVMAEQARQKETAARTQAEQAEKAAQQQRQQAQRLLARAQLERGVKLLNEGNCLGLLDLLDARITADDIADLRDSAARLWAIAYDLWSDRLVQIVRGADDRDIAFSPDGRLLATVFGTTAQLWNTATGQPHGPPLQLEKIIGAVVFSPDGKLLVTHSIEGVSQLWDSATGQPVGPILRHNGGTGKSSKKEWELNRAWRSAAFSPDGKLLATASLDGTVRLWKTDTDQPFGQPLRHDDGVWAVAFSPDGKLLASGADDKTARLWDVASGQPHGPALQHDGEVRKVAFSSDGKLVATMCGEARLWKTDTGQLHKRLVHGGWLEDLAFSPDGKLLATASGDWTVQLWNTQTGEPHGERLRHEAFVRVVAFSPDGKLLATSSVDKTVRLWDVATGQPYGQPLRHQGEVFKVVFSPDGKYLASSALEETTRIWRTYQPLNTEVVPRQSGAELGFISPNGKVGAIISGKMVQLWDTAAVKALGEPLRHDSDVLAVAFSPDTKLLATAVEGAIRLWDVASGQPLGSPLEAGWIDALTFSPDGKLLAVGSDWAVLVFEVATGRLLYAPYGGGGSVYGAAFSPDGKVLAAATEIGMVYQRDMATEQELASPLQHRAAVWAVAYSPDGDILATASGEEAQGMRLWDVSVRVGPPYLGLALPVTAVRGRAALGSFSSDGTLPVRKLPEGNARVWRLPAAPTDLREMQLRTWVALGVQRNPQGEVTAIPPEQWQELREELHYPEAHKSRARMPQIVGEASPGLKPAVKLTWTPGLAAVAHNVHFGNDPNKLEFLRQVKDACFENLTTLDRDFIYWCRVDEVKSDGAIVKGDLWSLSVGKIVGWWKFDETSGTTAFDLSGGGHNGTVYGGAAMNGSGILTLDGSNDYVSLPIGPVISSLNSCTIAVWVNFLNTGGTWQRIFDFGTGITVNMFLTPRMGTSGPMRFAITTSRAGMERQITAPGTLANGPHLVVVRINAATDTGTLFLDGSPVAANNSMTLAPSNLGSTTNNWLGRSQYGADGYFNGSYDEVRIYNYALSESEINALYAGEGPGPIVKPKWVVDVSSKEYAPPAPEPQKRDEYYVPLASELERNEAEQILIEKQEEIEIKRRVLGEEQPGHR